jgi:two-component system KDP operon response regulator KdpE
VPKILVVEDDPDIRQLLHLQLTTADYETAFATDAASALAVARRERPDLILLDIGLPAGDGFVVMERLKSFPDFEMVPVVVITARDKLEGERAVELGARSFFQKPFESDQLIGEIRRVLGQ